MKCNYANIQCDYLDTSGMTVPIECYECEHYDIGIRETGATPVLAWIVEKLKNPFQMKTYQDKKKYHCPLCGRKYYTKEQALSCMSMCEKEKHKKKR